MDDNTNRFEARRNARNHSTKETCPCTIWMHEVICAAIANAPDAGVIAREPDVRGRLLRAYNAGEAVWMAADTLILTTRVRTRERKASAEVKGMRTLLAEATKGKRSW